MKQLFCIALILLNVTGFVYSNVPPQPDDNLARLAADYQHDDLSTISESDQELTEYDTQVCDTVELQKVSWLEAKARQAGVAILFRLLAAKEFVKNGFQKVKYRLAKLIGVTAQ